MTFHRYVTLWPLSSRTMKYEFLPALGTALLLLGMLFLTSCRSALPPAVGPLFPAVVALVTSCKSALFTRCGSALLASYLLDHPIRSLLILSKYSSVLLRSCLSITPSVTLSWRSMNCLVANCSLVCTACSLTCCVWFAGLTGLRAHRCPALVTSLSADTSVLRVCSASGLWSRLPPKLLEQSSAPLLFRCCGHRRAGRVPRGQWALLDTDMLILIDRSACLVEPEVFAPLSSVTCPCTGSGS